MSGQKISRRVIVPALAAGATGAAALQGNTAAEAAVRRRSVSQVCGPCNLWRGQTLRINTFLLSTGRGTDQGASFRLLIQTADGTTLVNHLFDADSGKGVVADLAFHEDGTLTFNGAELPNVPQNLVVIAIIAILIGLLLPAVQKVRATATSFIPGVAGADRNVSYLLPFVEQDN